MKGIILSEPKVCIITEGSRTIGFGHMTRCSGIYEAFCEIGIIPLFILNSDDLAVSLVKKKNFIIFDWLKNKSKLFSLIENMDIVIIDSYLADNEMYEKISELVRIPIYLDDDKRMDYPSGTVVNGTIHAKSLNYPEIKNVEYLLGTNYIPLRREFWNVPLKKINGTVCSVMLTFGGDDLRNMTPKLLETLTEHFPDIIKRVVIGRGFKNIKEIEKLKSENVELIIYPEASGMIETMIKSDVCISAGGQTLYELARIGVPTMAVAVAYNQINNVNYWKRTEFIEYAGFWNESRLAENVVKKMKYLCAKKIRLKKSQIGKHHVDGLGSSRVVTYCLDKYNKG